MGITYVIRANEWVASITKHIELWNKLGVNPIKYGHIMPINKKDGNSVRKLSKRKDPEASVSYYLEQGYPVDSVKSYLIRLANPSFDMWWDKEVIDSTKENREINYKNYITHFNFDELKRNSRGPLLDFDKLNNISADVIGSMSASEVTQRFLSWANIYDKDFFEIVNKDKNYLEKVFNIEREGETKRKDIYAWSAAKSNIFYMWDELYVPGNVEESKLEILSEISKSINEDKYFDMSIDIPEWIKCFKEICANNEILSKYKFGEIMMILRKKITGLEKTPNLYFIFNVLGRERVLLRLK
jgi:glutamyl-tRNA synthetase